MKRISTLWAAPALKRMAFALLFLGSITIAQAQINWDRGAGTNNWRDANNWNPNGIPANNATVTIGSGFTVDVNGASNVGNLTVSGTLNVNNNLTVANGGSVTVNTGGSIVFNSTAQIKGGETGNNKGVTLKINSGANLTTANPLGFNTVGKNTDATGSIAINPGNNNSGFSYSAEANYTYNGADGQVTGNALTGANNLTVSTAGTLTTANNITITGTMTVNSGAIFSPGATNIISRGTTGTLVGTGTLQVTRVAPSTNPDLLTQYQVLASNIPGIESLTVDYAGLGNQTINPITYGNLKTSNSGTKTVGGTGALKISGNLTVSSGTTLDVGDNAAENITSNPATKLLVEDNATLKIGGNRRFPENFGTYDLKPTSTVNFYGGSHFILGRTFGNLVLSGGTTVTAREDETIVGNLTINSGTTFNATNASSVVRTHTIKGNWTNNGSFDASTSIVVFNRTTGAQTIGGSSQTTFENLVVDNASGITLAQTVGIGADGGNGSITFTKGVINSSAANLLIIYPNGTVDGMSNTSFVNGPVRKIGNDDFIFPIGKTGAGYHPVAISGGGTSTDAFTAEYIRASATALDHDFEAGGELKAVSNCEYWKLDRSTGARDAKVTLYWNENSPCGGPYIINPAVLVVAHLKDGAWQSHGGDFTGNANNGSVASVGGITDFDASNTFTIGTTDAAQAPLPVTFVSFTGRKVGNGTQLTWNVAGEVNAAGYEVERKTGNGQFAKIGYVAATGSSSYTFTDATPQKGVVFYRIKNVDQDGTFSYSTPVSFKNGAGIVVFPTMVSGKTTVLHDAAGASAFISLSTADGRQVKLQKPQAGSAQTQVDLTGLQAGLYLLKWSDGAGHTETVKLVKQ